ncbi:MAG TPA: haloacid dehalogenase type II [Rhodanobacteraceae bacterium]|nr:haloacid dehalogenase type II [Rhodanobacteraceae bacterium]
MSKRIAAVAFDVLGTLFSLDALRSPLAAIGLPATVLETWFAQTLRDAFALEITEVFKPFREIASDTLKGLMAKNGLSPDDDKVERVLEHMAELAPHPDAEAALTRLHDAGIPVLTLTNGSAETTRTLLRRARLESMVERVITIEEVQHWKPRRTVYQHAAEAQGVESQEMVLVSAHPWDIHGAAHAGLRTAFVARGQPFPSAMLQPDFRSDTLAEIATALISCH